jgi:hypothetical protein
VLFARRNVHGDSELLGYDACRGVSWSCETMTAVCPRLSGVGPDLLVASRDSLPFGRRSCLMATPLDCTRKQKLVFPRTSMLGGHEALSGVEHQLHLSLVSWSAPALRGRRICHPRLFPVGVPGSLQVVRNYNLPSHDVAPELPAYRQWHRLL